MLSLFLQPLQFFSPVPSISWKRSDGTSLAKKIQHNRTRGVLEIPNVEQEDEGSYECMAGNTRGINIARGQLFVYGKQINWILISNDDVQLYCADEISQPLPGGWKFCWLKSDGELSVTLTELEPQQIKIFSITAGIGSVGRWKSWGIPEDVCTKAGRIQWFPLFPQTDEDKARGAHPIPASPSSLAKSGNNLGMFCLSCPSLHCSLQPQAQDGPSGWIMAL